MAFLTINSVAYPVQHGAAQGQSEDVGSRKRTWNGNLRIGLRRQPRSWQFQLAPILDTDFLTLQTSAALGAFLPCTGDFSNAVTVSCTVDITSAEFFRKNPTDVLRRLVSLTLTEA
jgi:hypothetical protein